MIKETLLTSEKEITKTKQSNKEKIKPNKYINCINYLFDKKTNLIPHSKGNFLDHLIEVYNILRKWNCNEDICFAGLLHSVYGNDIFQHQIENDRKVISNLVGTKAEKIIFTFNKNRHENKEVSLISFANDLSHDYIQIFKNLYDKKDIDDFYSYFKDQVNWGFIGGKFDTNLNKWRKFIYFLKNENLIEKKLLNITENLLKNLNIFNFVKLQKCYASANPYGTVHETHTDVDDKYTSITVMYYLNNNWSLDNAGETVFFDFYNNEIIKSIIPSPSKIVVFDGGIPHAARDVRRDVSDLRMVLTFKYKIEV